MSSLQFDKHTLCLSCRDVTRSVDLRCVECMAWSTFEMADYLRHRKSLVSKGRKPKSVTTASSSPSVPPSATPVTGVASPTPCLSSIADDEKLKSYVQSALTNLLSQPGSQVSLGINPFISAPAEVPNITPPGSTGGNGSESVQRGRFAAPSGMVPPAPEEDVMPPFNVSLPYSVASGVVGRVPGSPSPSLGDFTHVSGASAQLRSRGVSVFTHHVVSADVHDVPKSVSSLDPTSLLFPFWILVFSSCCFVFSSYYSSYFLSSFCRTLCPSSLCFCLCSFLCSSSFFHFLVFLFEFRFFHSFFFPSFYSSSSVCLVFVCGPGSCSSGSGLMLALFWLLFFGSGLFLQDLFFSLLFLC